MNDECGLIADDVFLRSTILAKGIEFDRKKQCIVGCILANRDLNSKHSNINTVMYSSIYTDVLLLWSAYDPFQLYLG